ncbi:MAG: hypothetical protein P4K98_13185 [Bryobacteraceae bacterium]|nr:hypothetical protein [Bryobacteraceae bacterium]
MKSDPVRTVVLQCSPEFHGTLHPICHPVCERTKFGLYERGVDRIPHRRDGTAPPLLRFPAVGRLESADGFPA